MIIFPEILLIAEAFEETKAFVAEVAVTFPTTIAVPVEELLMPYAALPVPPVTFPVTFPVKLPANVLSAVNPPPITASVIAFTAAAYMDDLLYSEIRY